jgi:cation:H+ antiporter
MSLFRHDRALAAILNITVSNITNIWLAALGVSVYLIYY